MRGRAAALALVLLAGGGCREGWTLGLPGQSPPAAPTLAWTAVEAGALTLVDEQAHRTVRYRVALSQGGAGAAAVEVRFHRPLDGAKADAFGLGPHGRHTLLHERRVGGDTVVIPVGALPVEAVEVVVHHHLRPPPLLYAARVGRPVTPR